MALSPDEHCYYHSPMNVSLHENYSVVSLMMQFWMVMSPYYLIYRMGPYNYLVSWTAVVYYYLM